MKQGLFLITGFFDKGKTTKRERFLAGMDQVVPWARLLALIEPHYQKEKANPEGGCPPLPLERVFRIYCLQQWCNLSDPGAEEALCDSLAMRQFTNMREGTDIIPVKSSILNFRQLLVKHQLTAQLLVEINTHLSERGLLLGKGKQWYFGMKVHTGTGTDSGIAHTVAGTAANVANINALGELLHGAKECLHGGSAYHAKAQADAAGMAFNVNQRGTRSKPLTEAQRLRNRRLSRVRATVGHPFLVFKHLCGHAKIRYQGIEKNLAQILGCSRWPMYFACDDS